MDTPRPSPRTNRTGRVPLHHRQHPFPTHELAVVPVAVDTAHEAELHYGPRRAEHMLRDLRSTGFESACRLRNRIQAEVGHKWEPGNASGRLRALTEPSVVCSGHFTRPRAAALRTRPCHQPPSGRHRFRSCPSAAPAALRSGTCSAPGGWAQETQGALVLLAAEKGCIRE